jgi:phage gp16-like protein
MNTNPRQFDRNSYYTKLAIGKAELGWDDEFYYGIWLPMQGASKKPGTEQYSASTLSNTQLFAALEAMIKAGFKVKPKSGNHKNSRKLADDAQSKKIRALWLELHEVGKVRDPSEASLGAYVKRQTKVEALQWLSTEQASRVIESLKSWLSRPVKPAA